MKRNIREFILFLFVAAFVLIVNQPIISYNMFYPEQALIFLANQKINGLSDLLNIYIHPQLFHLAIPFFRPSGHFLIYQALTPFLGWHSNKSLIIINLLFLASIGYLTVKIYKSFFPGFKYGGYIAFAIYLMHPALSLSRLIILHFEFAYVFFSLLSCYYFVVFLQKNANTIALLPIKNNLQSLSLLLFSLFFYIFAVTFKEAALVIGGVLLAYYLVFLYNRQTIKQLFLNVLYTKQLRQIFILLVLVSITLSMYVSLPWPAFSHPFQNHFGFLQFYLSFKEFFKLIFGFGNNFHSNAIFQTTNLSWRAILFPFYTRIILWFSLLVCLASMFVLFFSKQQCKNTIQARLERRKSCLFLIMASGIALILPLGWGVGLPWHLSLVLLFLSILFGFSFEYGYSFLLSEKAHHVIVIATSLCIGITAYGVNQKNVQRYSLDQDLNFKLTLNRNAILNPPSIKRQLNANSVLVEVDSMGESYMFGAGFYPLQGVSNSDFALVKKGNHLVFLKIQSNFNGTLFRWSYLMPSLREELYPFQIDEMKNVPDEIIYDWLQSFNNIFCIGYDEKANWIDNTANFKQQLLKERLRRNIKVHDYATVRTRAYGGGNVYKVKSLDYSDVKICKYICSQDKQCLGFNYINSEMKGLELHQCHFMNRINIAEIKLCSVCEAYRKINVRVC